jgi:hypothetical protein
MKEKVGGGEVKKGESHKMGIRKFFFSGESNGSCLKVLTDVGVGHR